MEEDKINSKINILIYGAGEAGRLFFSKAYLKIKFIMFVDFLMTVKKCKKNL